MLGMNYSQTPGWWLFTDYCRATWQTPEGLTVDEGTRRLVLHDVSCPHCRRFFCQVWAPEGTVLKPACEGCEREGRGSL